jgi:prepilin-type N-terminal cleavage/methylation domain-containing protein/prepilin-type processing-associated H-X9-DG protein
MSMMPPTSTGGRAGRRPAFTLIELLVVLTILALLVALLAPAAMNAWKAAQMTACQTNLARLFQAQAVWRSDNDYRLLTGGAWMGRLMPYVEYDLSLFSCQAAAEYGPREDWEGADSDYEAGDEDGGGGADVIEQTQDTVNALLMFEVYHQTKRKSGIRGNYAWSIPLASHHWVRRTRTGDSVLYESDDEDPTMPGANPKTKMAYDDIKTRIDFDPDTGEPLRVHVLMSPDTRKNWSSVNRFIYDFRICDEVIVSDWVSHIGEVIELAEEEDEEQDPTTRNIFAGSWHPGRAAMTVRLILGDYALSTGAYEAPDGRSVSQADGRLFYILDYGFKQPLADYNHPGNDPDHEWDKYFIEDAVTWREAFPEAGDWRRFQALRHFGRANVLFMDGHIESLGPEDLEYSSPLWRNQGR